ncbi:FAD-dependent monooxygenase [Saccharopolyspora rosea]|uniref:FAD-dependent monooxygenase n=1 Tax=Saccharopolyspora rosea TaxID=524884 RepID=UPI0021D942FE|nr:FAD-dependent monooxygenase [Saccharopolyspora rosea]
MGTWDVVVVGAGPVGLLLGGDLAAAGVRVAVLDRSAEPSREPKANAVVGQATRLLQPRGVLVRLGQPGPPTAARVFQFGGLRLDLADLAATPLHGVAVPQQALERALAERAVEAGARVRRSAEVVGIDQDDRGVRLRVRAESAVREVTAAYAAGCDGGGSTVRRLAGIGFPGVTDSTVVSRSADVVVPGGVVSPETAQADLPGIGRIGLYGWHRTARGAYAALPRPTGSLLISVMEWDESTADTDPDGAMELDEFTAAVRRVLGADLVVEEPTGPGPHQRRRWRGRNTRIADSYRNGRVFLAGDAAHVHNAIGAPGLNLGLQDAANLGWRLAAAVAGRPGALAGYDGERRIAAHRVAMHSQAQTALLAPDGGITALRALLTELLEEPAVRARLATMLEGADVRYPAPPGAHPLVGRFVPDGLARYLDATSPVLFDLGAASTDVPAGIRVISPDGATLPARSLLVRPDGYVAWASDEDGPAAAAGLRQALDALFGD